MNCRTSITAGIVTTIVLFSSAAFGQDAAQGVPQIRVGTVDFLGGDLKGRCGCPTVMNKNYKQQMVLILTDQPDDDLARLMTRLNGKTVDGGSVHGHLVYLPSKNHRTEAEKQADADQVNAFSVKHGAAKFITGVKRSRKQQLFAANEIDLAVRHAVYLYVDGTAIAHWRFKTGELTEAATNEIFITAQVRFEDRYASDGQ